MIKKVFVFGNWQDSLYALCGMFLSAWLLLGKINLCSSQKDEQDTANNTNPQQKGHDFHPSLLYFNSWICLYMCSICCGIKEHVNKPLLVISPCIQTPLLELVQTGLIDALQIQFTDINSLIKTAPKHFRRFFWATLRCESTPASCWIMVLWTSSSYRLCVIH